MVLKYIAQYYYAIISQIVLDFFFFPERNFEEAIPGSLCCLFQKHTVAQETTHSPVQYYI